MHASPQEPSTRKLSPIVIAVGLVCLAAGAAGWFYLHQASQLPTVWAPPERQGLNAPFITTSDVIVDKMVELAELKEDDMVYDLGCGDGRIVITAALKSGCKGVGFDIDPERVAEAQENVRLHEVEDRVEIVEQDVFTVDLSKADAALMYLLPWMLEKLIPQFQEMEDGCKVISHQFWIEQVQPDAIIDLIDPKDNHPTSIYVYHTPLKIDRTMERGKPPQAGNSQ